MDDRSFESLIARLEVEAKEYPQRYLATALGVVLLGFAVFSVAIFFALAPILILIGMLGLVIATGGQALLFLLALAKLSLWLILPAWVMIRSSMTILFARFPRPEGREISPSEAPKLFSRIVELRQIMKGRRIDHVLLTNELNASIVQHPRFGLFGGEENYLIIGLPLLHTMSEEEALSVVAHEYAHLSGHHSRINGFIYRCRSAWGRMQLVSKQWKDWGSRLIARLFDWYGPYFDAYTFVLARQNEYHADQFSVEVVGTRNAANALIRVNIISQFENEVFWPLINSLVAEHPQPMSDLSSLWIKSIEEQLDKSARQRYLEIARQLRTDHIDTHPAISDRLKAIGGTLGDTDGLELSLPSINAAEIWLGISLYSIQAQFDKNWQKDVLDYWQQRHDYLNERRAILANLESQQILTTDEQWDIIQLKKELSPDFLVAAKPYVKDTNTCILTDSSIHELSF